MIIIRQTRPAVEMPPLSSPMTASKYMLNGASSGKGVYLANDLSCSIGYSHSWRAGRKAAAAAAAVARANIGNPGSAPSPAVAANADSTGAAVATPPPPAASAAAAAPAAPAPASASAPAPASAANVVLVAAGGGGVPSMVDPVGLPAAIVAVCEVIDRCVLNGF